MGLVDRAGPLRVGGALNRPRAVPATKRAGNDLTRAAATEAELGAATHVRPEPLKLASRPSTSPEIVSAASVGLLPKRLTCIDVAAPRLEGRTVLSGLLLSIPSTSLGPQDQVPEGNAHPI